MCRNVSERVECSMVGGVADVRLNRPDKLNALDDAMYDGLLCTAAALRKRDDLRAVVLSGAGRGFCAGLDLTAFRAMAGGGAFRAADADERAAQLAQDGIPGLSRGQRAVLGFRNLPVPVIAAVRGPALGAGLQLALGAHIRIVAPDASLGSLEINWGLTPDMTGTQLLPRLVGKDVALEMILTGRIVDGVEAVRLGLATQVADDPVDAALRQAAQIAERNPDAVRELVRMLAIDSFEEGLAAERAAMHAIVGSPNQRAAAARNLERRSKTSGSATAATPSGD